MWLKICGITDEDDARLAAGLGVNALGFVFWPGSRRFVAPTRASSIAAALPGHVERVGVFVDQDPAVIEGISQEVGLDAVQLHRSPGPTQGSGHAPWAAGYRDLVGRPRHRCEETAWSVLRLIAVLTVDPGFDVASVDALPRSITVLLDAAERGLPGGTGKTIDWGIAARVARRRATVLAGGLTPENVADAIRIVQPSGVDVASGVEFPGRPGTKDPDRLKRFVAAVRGAEVTAR
ncbi:MAG: N-(5'-phosphoribosyl)anthranilate isomerase [Vicinamibacterales bacterium]